MRKLDPRIRREIGRQDDKWVEIAHTLATRLREEEDKNADKRGQLRNIQDIAESGDSWKALELFIRYQAARKELKIAWAEEAIRTLEQLKGEAKTIASKAPNTNPADVHLELIARVLGYAVRWHTWDVKGKEAS